MLTIRMTAITRASKQSQRSLKNQQLALGAWEPILLCLLFFSSYQSVSAATIVDVTTPQGTFAIELFDEQTPGTVANFLNYVNSGRYNGTVIHRSRTNFVVQGGGFAFNPLNASLDPITVDASIANEPGISNLRGTIAMAKFSGDPNSATSQWFINLSDTNTFLDSSNGGFTVFGRVIEEGMTVVDSIAALNTSFTFQGEPIPLINFDGQNLTIDNLVTVQMAERQPANSFDAATNRLNIKVDLGDGSLISVQFSLESDSPTVVVRADASSVANLSATVPGISTFDAGSGRLTLPELAINGQVAYRNLVFQLSDSEQLLFSLISFE